MKRDKLNIMVCLPCAEMPANDRLIVVKATDGKRTQFIKFGRHTSMNTIMFRTPSIFIDRAYDERRKRRKVRA
ncbi:hypothetical protein RCG24_20590 [Neobacillus sp. OS1-32]|uniref:hypothetical protein n=1 Tax=Neobacillus sp. OS1-32 TaxID=3070682 RepID=UPI0027DF4FE6|nr:hypothetical protein [Neobacillus sp. OS1-32]WML30248.1 hypothetical protein RCG24_20590 [Neobacillus sp. OS1-32]